MNLLFNLSAGAVSRNTEERTQEWLARKEYPV